METEENNSNEDLSVSSHSTVNECKESNHSESEDEESEENVEDTVKTDDRTENIIVDEEKCLKPTSSNDGVVSLSEYHQLREETDRLMEELAAEKKKLDNQCKELVRKLDTAQHQLAEEKERADAADSNLKKKLEQLIGTESEKDALMSRLTVLDQEKIRLLDEQVTIERKWKENIKECEKLQAQVKSQRSEVNRLTTSIEKTESQLTDQTKELVKLREEVGSLNIKVKWAQNKLKSETEAHKESKTQLTITNKKLKQAKEEGEQIRADLKTMIKQYQESEEMRSNSLDVQLRKKKEELQNQEQEIADQQQLHTLTVKELEISKASLELAQRECLQLKTKVSELTTQITEKQEELDELRLSLDKQKDEGKKLESEITVMTDMNKDIESERRSHSALRESYSHLQKTLQQLEKELGRRKEKETELLAFSEKLSSSNAELQAEKTSLDSQLSLLQHETQSLSTLLSDTQTATLAQEAELKELRGLSQEKISLLMQQLTDKTMAVEQLTLTLEEEREEAVALRRKHASNIKDMQRQIQLYIKRIEQLESSNDDEVATLPVSHSHGSMGMRSISHGSLDGTTATLHAPPLLRAASPDVEAVTARTHLLQAPPGSPPSVDSSHPVSGSSSSGELFHTLDQEKTLLVEKICQLKRQLARREEKLEFYEGHSHQLTEDIQRKSKIIQSYIMREHSGVLAPPEADAHKMKLSRKHGIMASMFSGDVTKAPTDMTLELSLEINRKMQAVLEDTLLKNITLKESIDTLGQEISRLTTQLKSLQKSPSSR